MTQLIDGPAGALELRYEPPQQAPQGLALICHPHPLFGGTMDNKVVYALSRAAQNCGLASLRFNFRGVGGSEGEHADGAGELEDAAAVLAWGRSRLPAAPLLLAGFSFGAFIALMLAARTRPDALVTVAPPLHYADSGELPRPQCDWLLIHGDADDVVDCGTTLAQAEKLQPAPEVQVVEGAGHFFHGGIVDLGSRVERWISARF